MDPPLAVFPADLFLLSGDTIVNESMLTGESVPVSKVPISDEDLARWKDLKDVSGDISKSFLYAGTRVIRVRGGLTTDGSAGPPALGLVVRTGELNFVHFIRYADYLRSFQHHEGCISPLYAIPQTHRLQVLPRFYTIYSRARGFGRPWILC